MNKYFPTLPDVPWHESRRIDRGDISIYVSDSAPRDDAFVCVTPRAHSGVEHTDANTGYFMLDDGACFDARNLSLLAQVLVGEGSSKTVETFLGRSLYDIPVAPALEGRSERVRGHAERTDVHHETR